MAQLTRLARLLAPLLLVFAMGGVAAMPAAAQESTYDVAPGEPDAADAAAIPDATAVLPGDEADSEEDRFLDGSGTGADSAESADGEERDPCATKSLKEDDGGSEEDGTTSDFSSCEGTTGKGSRQTLADVLRRGRLSGGKVTLKGAGNVVQTLTAGCSAHPKRVRTLLGRASRKVSAPGDVELSVPLNRKGRAMLKRARGKVCVTLATRIAERGKKARGSSRTIWLTPAAKKS